MAKDIDFDALMDTNLRNQELQAEVRMLWSKLEVAQEAYIALVRKMKETK